MVVPSFTAKGGITAVADGYRNSKLEHDFDVKYVETYCDGNVIKKLFKAFGGYISFIFKFLFWKPDIIHIHSSFGASFFRKKPFIDIAFRHHKPIVNHIHGADFDSFYRSADDKTKNKIKSAYSKCSYIIALSDEWKTNLSEIVDESKIAVIENYGKINEQAVLDRQQKKIENNILFLGFIGERKGCYDVPAIAEKVIAKIPYAKFILGGSGEIEKIISMSSEQVKKSLVFPGWVRNEKKDELLKQADVFFLPSYNEGMPMSILDAMGYGLPVVSTTVGGITKIVRNDVNGYTFAPGDIDGIANAVIKILSDKSLNKALSRKSAEIITEEYSLNQHISKLEKLYGAL